MDGLSSAPLGIDEWFWLQTGTVKVSRVYRLWFGWIYVPWRHPEYDSWLLLVILTLWGQWIDVAMRCGLVGYTYDESIKTWYLVVAGDLDCLRALDGIRPMRTRSWVFRMRGCLWELDHILAGQAKILLVEKTYEGIEMIRLTWLLMILTLCGQWTTSDDMQSSAFRTVRNAGLNPGGEYLEIRMSEGHFMFTVCGSMFIEVRWGLYPNRHLASRFWCESDSFSCWKCGRYYEVRMYRRYRRDDQFGTVEPCILHLDLRMIQAMTQMCITICLEICNVRSISNTARRSQIEAICGVRT